MFFCAAIWPTLRIRISNSNDNDFIDKISDRLVEAVEEVKEEPKSDPMASRPRRGRVVNLFGEFSTYQT